MSAIQLGQKFPSLNDFKRALRNWAIASNFTPSILDSDSRRVRAGCRTSEGCPFRIRCNFNSKNGYASVTTLEDVHTCTSRTQPGSQGIKRAEACKLKFLLEAVPQLMTVDRTTPTKAIIDAVKNRYGQEIAMRQAQKVKAILVPKNAQSCVLCGAQDHTRERCPNDPRSSLNQDDQDHSMMDGDSTMDRGHNDIQEQQASAQQMPSPPEPSRAPTRASMSHNFQQPHMQQQQIPQQPNIPAQNTHNTHREPPRAMDPNMMGGRNSVFRNNRQMSPPQQGVQAAHPVPTTYAPVRESAQPSREPPPQTPQDIRLEAARLMQRAAQLMEQAARLNSEAARLTASVAAS